MLTDCLRGGMYLCIEVVQVVQGNGFGVPGFTGEPHSYSAPLSLCAVSLP